MFPSMQFMLQKRLQENYHHGNSVAAGSDHRGVGRGGKYRIKLFKMASRVKHINMRTYGAT
jgi:hypothetical protein